MRTKIKIPKGYKPNERKAIAKVVVREMQNRTAKGLDKDNKKFIKYSTAYINSAAFKNAGKSASSVNLDQTGEMNESYDHLSDSDGEINIGFERGDKDNNGKAESHIKGKRPKNQKGTGPIRDFLGISQGDLNRILKKHFPLKDKEKREETMRILDVSDEIADEVASQFTITPEDIDGNEQ